MEKSIRQMWVNCDLGSFTFSEVKTTQIWYPIKRSIFKIVANLSSFRSITFRQKTCSVFHWRHHILYRLPVTMLHRTMSSGPQIKVHPDGHLLVDDKLEIKVTGLPQHQKTTLHAVITEGGNVFESCSCYTADDNGEVNLATQPSIAGSYTGRPTVL